MPDDRISLRQLLALLFAALLAPAIGVLPSQTAALAGEAGWLSALAALPGAIMTDKGVLDGQSQTFMPVFR